MEKPITVELQKRIISQLDYTMSFAAAFKPLMSLRKNTLLIGALLSLGGAHAQFSEIGATVGANYYIGDLNPYKHFPKNTATAIGIVYKYNINSRFAFNLTGLRGKLEAFDANLDDPVLRERNLHFRTRLYEASGTLEINFFDYRIGKNKKPFTPYVFFGFGYFRTNPETQVDDSWFDLQPLGTEGQASSQTQLENYKRDHLNLPFGVGFKATVSRIDVGLSFGMRRTWTDYIDDVSGLYVDNRFLSIENGPLAGELADQNLTGEPYEAGVARGDSELNDWYVYTGLTVTYVLTPRFMECWELNLRMK